MVVGCQGGCGEGAAGLYRRGMRRLATLALVLLVVLGAAGVVADRVFHARAQSEVLGAISEHVALAPGADIEIDGFPFLTQVRAGRLAEVRGSAPEIALDGVVLTAVRAAARGVSPEAPFQAETVELNADVPVRTVRAVLVRELPLLDGVIEIDVVDSRLRLTTTIGGFDLAVGLEPTLLDGRIGFVVGEVLADDDVVLEGGLLGPLNDALAGVRFDIPALPEGLAPTRLGVIDEGLRVRLEGTDVVLATP